MERPDLITERCRLRLLQAGNAVALARFHAENRDHLAPWEPARGEDIYTKEFWLNRIAQADAEYSAQHSIRFCILLRDTGELIGTVNFTRMARGVFQCCGLGYNLGAAWQGQGLMTEALQASIGYVFGTLGFHRIEANYIPANDRSARVLQRLGFEKEGYAKAYLRIAGEWQDHVLTSLTNPDWKDREV